VLEIDLCPIDRTSLAHRWNCSPPWARLSSHSYLNSPVKKDPLRILPLNFNLRTQKCQTGLPTILAYCHILGSLSFVLHASHTCSWCARTNSNSSMLPRGKSPLSSYSSISWKQWPPNVISWALPSMDWMKLLLSSKWIIISLRTNEASFKHHINLCHSIIAFVHGRGQACGSVCAPMGVGPIKESSPDSWSWCMEGSSLEPSRCTAIQSLQTTGQSYTAHCLLLTNLRSAGCTNSITNMKLFGSCQTQGLIRAIPFHSADHTVL